MMDATKAHFFKVIIIVVTPINHCYNISMLDITYKKHASALLEKASRERKFDLFLSPYLSVGMTTVTFW
jgi:hypothetical protein